MNGFDGTKAKRIAVGVLLVFIGFYIGLNAGERKSGQAAIDLINTEVGKPAGVDFAPFWQAWKLLEEKFVPTSSTTVAKNEDKVWGAIKGLADSYGDPYTVFLPPVESEIFEADVRGNFEGVGMEVGMRDNTLTVIAPLKDTPAYRAGIKAGDMIIRIDGDSISGFSTEQSIAIIRGEKGTPVTFTIAREGVAEPLEITVYRDTISIPTINTERLSNGVFVISLYNFSSVSPELFRQALREFIESRTDKLILDLRGNPGGYLEASIDMASWFLPLGRPIVTEDFAGKEENIVYRSRGYDVFNDKLKMVILVDGGSASASEILAGALHEHGIAVLVGEKTYGKGSVQELMHITADTSLKVTVARWLTPKGLSISLNGIAPDFAVVNDKKGIDSQRAKAESLLLDNDYWETRKSQ